jgi:hypothetical protein
MGRREEKNKKKQKKTKKTKKGMGKVACRSYCRGGMGRFLEVTMQCVWYGQIFGEWGVSTDADGSLCKIIIIIYDPRKEVNTVEDTIAVQNQGRGDPWP